MQQERLGSWFKQRDNMWVTAWAYVLCTTLLRLPFSLLDALVWGLIVYWSTGLAPEASRYLPGSPALSGEPLMSLYALPKASQ